MKDDDLRRHRALCVPPGEPVPEHFAAGCTRRPNDEPPDPASLDRRRFGLGAGAALLTALSPRVARAAPREAGESLAGLSVGEAARRVRSGEASAGAMVEAALSRIATEQPVLNAFISIFADRARQEAATLDAEQRAGRIRGPLHGVVLSVKDNIDTGGQRTTGGSPAFQMRIPATDAPAIARLRAAGAIIIGKNNLNELAMSDGRQSYFGRVRNPWSLDRATGGSSSGSCAAVAAGVVHAAIGTDTGGSIRNPAAWCGTVGLKPTNGLVPNRGTLPLSPSLDTIGPITRSVEDAALLLTVMAGYDRLDITSEAHPAEDYGVAMRTSVRALRVARLVGHFDRIASDVSGPIEGALAMVADLIGRPLGEAVLPDGGKAMTLMPFGETYAWYRDSLADHRYLFSATDQATLDALAEAKAVDYIQASWALQRLRRTVNDAFADHDLMLFPTLHTVAPLLGAPPDPDGARGHDAAFDAGLLNILGLPGISIPCGFGPAGLPIGLCIVGPRFGEGTILALASAFERATPWHDRRPAIARTPIGS